LKDSITKYLSVRFNLIPEEVALFLDEAALFLDELRFIINEGLLEFQSAS
jgi:hypothetical protein